MKEGLMPLIPDKKTIRCDVNERVDNIIGKLAHDNFSSKTEIVRCIVIEHLEAFGVDTTMKEFTGKVNRTKCLEDYHYEQY